MKTLISDIYNKIMELFQFEKSQNTGECAASRLQVILMHDRTKLDPLIMNKMREELIDVFSKYVVINKEELEIGLKNEGDAAALMLNIPIVRAKTEEELNEIRKKLQEEEQKVNNLEETESEEKENAEDAQLSEETAAQDAGDDEIVEETDIQEQESAVKPEDEITEKKEDEIQKTDSENIDGSEVQDSKGNNKYV